MAMATDHDTENVSALLQEWADAERTADSDAYASLLTDDFIGIGPAGFVLSRDQWEQRFANGLINHTFDVVQPHIRFHEQTAIIEAQLQQDSTFVGSKVQGSFRLGLVVIRAHGGWRLASVQISGPMPEPGSTPSFVAARQ